MKIFAVLIPLLLGPSGFASPLVQDPRILVIGDSHSVGPFGKLLVDGLRLLTPKTSLYASCGTVASSWLTGAKTRCGFYFRTEENKVLSGKIGLTPKLPGMLETLKPDILVIELGANYVKGFDEESAIADMKKILDLLKDLPTACLWVGAPDSRISRTERSRLFAWVEKAASERCMVLDSREFTHYPETEGDGIHYSRESDVKAWVDAVVSATRSLFKESPF
jgi:hypothetical protein